MSNVLKNRIKEVLATYLQERNNRSDQTQHRLSRLNIVRDAIYENCTSVKNTDTLNWDNPSNV